MTSVKRLVLRRLQTTIRALSHPAWRIPHEAHVGKGENRFLEKGAALLEIRLLGITFWFGLSKHELPLCRWELDKQSFSRGGKQTVE